MTLTYRNLLFCSFKQQTHIVTILEHLSTLESAILGPKQPKHKTGALWNFNRYIHLALMSRWGRITCVSWGLRLVTWGGWWKNYEGISLHDFHLSRHDLTEAWARPFLSCNCNTDLNLVIRSEMLITEVYVPILPIITDEFTNLYSKYKHG